MKPRPWMLFPVCLEFPQGETPSYTQLHVWGVDKWLLIAPETLARTLVIISLLLSRSPYFQIGLPACLQEKRAAQGKQACAHVSCVPKTHQCDHACTDCMTACGGHGPEDATVPAIFHCFSDQLG